MVINNIGFNHTHDADFHINRPYGSGDYLLILLKTSAIFTFENKNYNSEPNSFILYEKGFPQHYHVSGASFSNDWFHFTANEQELAWLYELRIPFNTVIKTGDLLELSMIINSLSYETYSSNQKNLELIDLYMRIFFIKLSKKLKDSDEIRASGHYNRLSIVRAKIYNNPEHHWTIDGLAHELTMSRSTIQHLYKSFFRVSPMEDVVQSRLERAKYLLTTTNTSIRGIAEFCGYHSEIHFMRQFKNRIGTTPSDYRKHHFTTK